MRSLTKSITAELPGTEVGKTYGRTQLARLFRLVLILQTDRHPNARELAERCEVSRRTIYRDLELLAEAGVPVRYRTEHQGYQLLKGFFLPPTSLDEAEALAILVLARQSKEYEGLGLLRHAWQGAVKLTQGLPQEIRERVLAAAEPFREVAAAALDAVPEGRKEIQDTVTASLTHLRQIRVWYRDPKTLAEECTKFSLYRVLLHDGRWYMVGRSTLHRRIEVIGIPWVQKVVATDDHYRIPPRFNLGRFLGQAWGIQRDPIRSKVSLRFSAQVSPELNDTTWHPSQKRVDLADGRTELHFVVDGIGEILRWVLGFGDQVEVLSPPELRRRVFEVAVRQAKKNRPFPSGRIRG